MSRKDYQRFAQMIAGEVEMAKTFVTDRETRILTISRMMAFTADIFAQDNDRFNREAFYIACGFTPDGFDLA